MKLRLTFVFLSVILVTSSCRKEEDPREAVLLNSINLADEFGLKTGSIEMGSDYRYQSYYDCGTNSVVSSNVKTIWDLAFSTEEPAHILLNSAKTNLRIAKYEGAFDDLIDPESLSFEYDLPDGDLTSLAVGTDMDGVWVLNRGLNIDGDELGFVKIEFTYSEGEYLIRQANLDGSNETSNAVLVDQDYNYMYYSCENGEMSVEPEKTAYDVLFTHYLYIYDPETEPFPYMVTGVLLNPSSVEVAEVFDLTFDQINSDNVLTFDYSNRRDIIGFEWKYFDFDLGFITDPSMNYVIKSTEGDYFKIHFTSFYNDEFEKGHPQFEIQKIMTN